MFRIMRGDDSVKRFFLALLCSLLCLLFLSGCKSSLDGLVRASAAQGDFQVELTSVQSVYDRSNLNPEAPLDFEVRVEYRGQQEEIHIAYGATLGYVWLCNDEGADILEAYSVTHPDYLKHGTLRPEEPFVKSFTGESAYKLLGGLPAGKYVAKTHVSFDVVEEELSGAGPADPKESIELNLELPFEIR